MGNPIFQWMRNKMMCSHLWKPPIDMLYSGELVVVVAVVVVVVVHQ